MLKKIKEFVNENKYYILGGAVLGAVLYLSTRPDPDVIETATSKFITDLHARQITHAIVAGQQVLYSCAGKSFRASIDGVPKDEIFRLLNATPGLVYNFRDVPDVNMVGVGLICLGSTLIANMLMKNNNMLGLSKSKPGSTAPVYFSDIFGNDDIKEKLGEFIDYLKNPKKYQEIGARTRKGILLYGPPGTGKTMIAKATACESGVRFLYCSAAEFQQIYVGVGPKRIRQLFAEARSCEEGCIIFIDEIDAVGCRTAGMNSAEGEKNSTINQLLTEMDGFYQNSNILVIGATNRQNMVDEALLRPGRFDLKIRTCLPNKPERIGILELHLRGKKQQISEQAVKHIAECTENCSGAQLEHIVNESAYVCLKEHKSVIEDQHLVTALKNEHSRSIESR